MVYRFFSWLNKNPGYLLMIMVGAIFIACLLSGCASEEQRFCILNCNSNYEKLSEESYKECVRACSLITQKCNL